MIKNQSPLEVWKYCKNSGNNTAIRIGNVCIYFSYSTVVAINVDGELFVSDNVFSTTTGKHINAINPDKSIRISRDKFEKMLDGINISIEMGL